MFEEKEMRRKGVGGYIDRFKCRLGLNPRFNGRRGSVLFITLILMTFMFAMVTALFYTANTQKNKVRTDIGDEQVKEETLVLNDLIFEYLNSFALTSYEDPEAGSLIWYLQQMIPGERLVANKQYFFEDGDVTNAIRELAGKYEIAIECLHTRVVDALDDAGVLIPEGKDITKIFEITTYVENSTSSNKIVRVCEFSWRDAPTVFFDLYTQSKLRFSQNNGVTITKAYDGTPYLPTLKLINANNNATLTALGQNDVEFKWYYKFPPVSALNSKAYDAMREFLADCLFVTDRNGDGTITS
ncbi:MAG: hypothetical protein LBN42_00390, partial [Oscillospiraceae bacterium]|nr:hypothetical protein [Oscillospiraceae bacterium]